MLLIRKKIDYNLLDIIYIRNILDFSNREIKQNCSLYYKDFTYVIFY